MTESAAQPGLMYNHLDSDIHEFVFIEPGKADIDQFFAILERLLIETPPDRTLRYLVDVAHSSRGVSLVAMAQRFRRLEAQIPNRARGRTAVLHRAGALLNFVDDFIHALAPQQDKTRFFTADRRGEALAWLLFE
ncbi:hypothetical protein FBR01_07520 [Anaerolineae bacterium CFX8]|nr:hypothetical protein [Anaerolineae bacterium CFX8]